ncbi:MAG: hypothetical protein HY936_03075 [Nitrosomonadales bacterium]|nr:hypothetical protein [Nitrosomonadales bacterium]
MINFLKVSVFSLLMVGAFWGFSNFGIPQIKPADPPGEAKIDLSNMTMEKFIALGADLFENKGDCALCHTGRRAPKLNKVAANADKAMKDPAYKGTAKTVEEYLRESMLKPSLYVVPGFGKKGTNDTESPMPDIMGAKVGFNEIEVLAAIAYIQDLSGSEITVQIPKPGAAPKAPEASKAGDCKK